MTDFARATPHLYHVAQRGAVESIRTHGLLPAALLVGAEHVAVTENRDRWTTVPGPSGEPVWLRWQSLQENALRTRLHGAVGTAAWRLFINGMVFLFRNAADAETLRRFPRDADRDQVILRTDTAALVEAGCALLVCRWNNGYAHDRQPVERRRLRRFDDYRPAWTWRRGEPIREVAVWGGIPPGVAFEVLPD